MCVPFSRNVPSLSVEIESHGRMYRGIYSIHPVLSPVSFIQWSNSFGKLSCPKFIQMTLTCWDVLCWRYFISGQVPQLCLLVQSDVLREQLRVQEKPGGPRPSLPRQHPQHQGLHGGQHLPLNTQHLRHPHEVSSEGCDGLSRSVTGHEHVEMTQLFIWVKKQGSIEPIFQIISLGRVNPAGADECPAPALDDNLRGEPGSAQHAPARILPRLHQAPAHILPRLHHWENDRIKVDNCYQYSLNILLLDGIFKRCFLVALNSFMFKDGVHSTGVHSTEGCDVTT